MENADYTRYRVRPGERFSLRTVDPDDTQTYPGKKLARRQLRANLERLSNLQERLYTDYERSVLVVESLLNGLRTMVRDTSPTQMVS